MDVKGSNTSHLYCTIPLVSEQVASNITVSFTKIDVFEEGEKQGINYPKAVKCAVSAQAKNRVSFKCVAFQLSASCFIL